MNKNLIAIFSLLIILTFIGYIIFDTVTSDSGQADKTETGPEKPVQDQWFISKEVTPSAGSPLSVAVSESGDIYLGGDSFLACYDNLLSEKWTLKTPSGISAIAVSGDTVFAASEELIFLVSGTGIMINEWGPYEANSIITSVSAGKNYLAFADAGIKRVFILKKNGEVHSMIGQSDKKFIIPSPYFDVALSGDTILYIANTGNHKIETWSMDGAFIRSFGEPGTASQAFCGCCNPAHFVVVPQGFITAEKGINRLKIVNFKGEFIEYVSSDNTFTPSVPLDIASDDGNTIYGVNSADSKLYVFKRK